MKADLVGTFSIKCLLKKIQCKKISEYLNIMNYTGAERDDLLNCLAHLPASTGFFLIAYLWWFWIVLYFSFKLCFLSLPMCVYSKLQFEKMFPNIHPVFFFTDFISPLLLKFLFYTELSFLYFFNICTTQITLQLQFLSYC